MLLGEGINGPLLRRNGPLDTAIFPLLEPAPNAESESIPSVTVSSPISRPPTTTG